MNKEKVACLQDEAQYDVVHVLVVTREDIVVVAVVDVVDDAVDQLIHWLSTQTLLVHSEIKKKLI